MAIVGKRSEILYTYIHFHTTGAHDKLKRLTICPIENNIPDCTCIHYNRSTQQVEKINKRYTLLGTTSPLANIH